MKRTVVIYKGKYGATKQYAQWIAEALSCDLVDADHFLTRDLEKYDNIIFGGALQAGGIKGFDLIRRSRMKTLEKKVILFVVGLNVDNQDARIQIRDINFNRAELSGMTVYYCMGAFDPSKVKGMDKAIIRLTLNMLEKKGEAAWNETERRLYHDMTEGADYVDRKYIEPVLAEFLGEEAAKAAVGTARDGGKESL